MTTAPPYDAETAALFDELMADVTGPLWRKPCASACLPARYPRVHTDADGNADLHTVCAGCGRILSSLFVHDEARYGPRGVDGLD